LIPGTTSPYSAGFGAGRRPVPAMPAFGGHQLPPGIAALLARLAHGGYRPGGPIPIPGQPVDGSGAAPDPGTPAAPPGSPGIGYFGPGGGGIAFPQQRPVDVPPSQFPPEMQANMAAAAQTAQAQQAGPTPAPPGYAGGPGGAIQLPQGQQFRPADLLHALGNDRAASQVYMQHHPGLFRGKASGVPGYLGKPIGNIPTTGGKPSSRQLLDQLAHARAVAQTMQHLRRIRPAGPEQPSGY
jgi:hypothetical protein